MIRAVVRAINISATDAMEAREADTLVVSTSTVTRAVQRTVANGAVSTLEACVTLACSVQADTIVVTFVGAGCNIASFTNPTMSALTQSVHTTSMLGALLGADNFTASSAHPTLLAHRGPVVRQLTVHNKSRSTIEALESIVTLTAASDTDTVVVALVGARADFTSGTRPAKGTVASTVRAYTVVAAVVGTQLGAAVHTTPASIADNGEVTCVDDGPVLRHDGRGKTQRRIGNLCVDTLSTIDSRQDSAVCGQILQCTVQHVSNGAVHALVSLVTSTAAVAIAATSVVAEVGASLELTAQSCPACVATAGAVTALSVARTVQVTGLEVASIAIPTIVARSLTIGESAMNDESLAAVLARVAVIALTNTIETNALIMALVGTGGNLTTSTSPASVAGTSTVVADTIVGTVKRTSDLVAARARPA
eukprot:GILJ01000722.1.p2 GENE.GILJ01000722.1~~GILJ01000722.1.p2  ORF type:complete len:423 (+),score=51.74 GILJ01000722.1:3002-4270(+)